MSGGKFDFRVSRLYYSVMKNEQLISVGPYQMGAEGLASLIRAFGAKNGHIVIGSAQLPEDIEKLAKKKNKPTVAIVQDYLDIEDTKKMVGVVKEKFPGIIVVVMGADDHIESADYQIDIFTRGQEIADFLTKLQH